MRNDSQSQRQHGHGRVRLACLPKREVDEVTALDYLHGNGKTEYLATHLGNRETTLVKADRWIIATAEDNRAEA